MVKVVFTDDAKRDLLKLDKKTRLRIVNKLRFFASDPLKFSRKLSHPSIGSFRFRIGEYRVIFDLKNDAIVILKVGHRRDIYAN